MKIYKLLKECQIGRMEKDVLACFLLFVNNEIVITQYKNIVNYMMRKVMES